MVVLLLSMSLTGVALAQDVHWSYEGEAGPEHWGELDPAFALCSTGVEQSPIDIASSSPLNPADLQFSYQPSGLTIVNNGHTIQANYDAGSTVQVDGQPYELLQFHFHNPSEHTVDGSAMPLELHFVHRNSEGGLAVVGVFLVEGAENAALAPVFDNIPATEGEPEAIDGVTINAADLLPAEQSYWRYDGSLTTPSCSEGVKWHVMQTPVEISADQLAAYTAIFHGNARPAQPLNERDFIVGQTPPTMPPTGAPLQGDPLLIVIVLVGAMVVLGAASYSMQRRSN
jgi:carbonic anhydrase